MLSYHFVVVETGLGTRSRLPKVEKQVSGRGVNVWGAHENMSDPVPPPSLLPAAWRELFYCFTGLWEERRRPVGGEGQGSGEQGPPQKMKRGF